MASESAGSPSGTAPRCYVSDTLDKSVLGGQYLDPSRHSRNRLPRLPPGYREGYHGAGMRHDQGPRFTAHWPASAAPYTRRIAVRASGSPLVRGAWVPGEAGGGRCPRAHLSLGLLRPECQCIARVSVGRPGGLAPDETGNGGIPPSMPAETRPRTPYPHSGGRDRMHLHTWGPSAHRFPARPGWARRSYTLTKCRLRSASRPPQDAPLSTRMSPESIPPVQPYVAPAKEPDSTRTTSPLEQSGRAWAGRTSCTQRSWPGANMRLRPGRSYVLPNPLSIPPFRLAWWGTASAPTKPNAMDFERRPLR